MVFIVDWIWSIMARLMKLGEQDLKTIENDVSAEIRSGVKVERSDGEIYVTKFRRGNRWYTAYLADPTIILLQRRCDRLKREELDSDAAGRIHEIIAVDLSFIDLTCMCRFEVQIVRNNLVSPPPPPPMPEYGLEDRGVSEVKHIPPPPPPMPECGFECVFTGKLVPPPPPPMPECGLEEAKKRRRRGGRRHKGHRRA